MKTLIKSALLILFTLPSYASDLPPCPEDQTQTYHNCFGTFTWSDGGKYVGEWKGGERNGEGTMTFPWDEKYIGEWKDNLRNGKGAMTYASGNKYIGEFKNDKRHGKGTFTWADGNVESGIFSGGKYLYKSVESARREARREAKIEARSSCAKDAGKAGTEYAAKQIEKTCLEQKGYGKAWYEW